MPLCYIVSVATNILLFAPIFLIIAALGSLMARKGRKLIAFGELLTIECVGLLAGFAADIDCLPVWGVIPILALIFIDEIVIFHRNS